MKPTPAKWTNGKSLLTGTWLYYRPSDTFYVQLARPVGFGGERLKSLKLVGEETPEWGSWKLIRGAHDAA